MEEQNIGRLCRFVELPARRHGVTTRREFEYEYPEHVDPEDAKRDAIGLAIGRCLAANQVP
jgi:hypothetical protein